MILWLAFFATCFLPAYALTLTAPENRVWEIFSIRYDSATAEVTDLGSRTETSTSNYDTAPIHHVIIEELPTEANRSLIGQNAEFKAADTGAFSAIGSTGKVGEQWLADNLGGESQVYFNTSQGARYVDQLANGIANESKVGYTSLTPSVQLQIAKDVELIQTEQIQGSTWHFFQSPVTGLGGPSKPLLNALQQNGINVIIH